MPDETDALRLIKPDSSERYDIGVFNRNADRIDAQFARGPDVPSPADGTLIAPAAVSFTVTGRNTIRAFSGASAGLQKVLTFSEPLTLANNDLSFILPGGHDIPTHAGDVAMFESVDSAAARWRLIGYVSARTTPRALWLPVTSFETPQTNGADPVVVDGTNFVYPAAAFDADTEEFLDQVVLVPADYRGADIAWRFAWSADATSGGVAWKLQVRAIADGEAIDGSLIEIGTVTDTVATTAERGQVSPVLTHTTNKPSASDLLAIRVSRAVDDTNDDLTEDARLIGLMGEF